MSNKTCCWDARIKDAFIEKWRKYHPLIADLRIHFPTWKIKQSTLVMGVMGSFERAKNVKQLSTIGIEGKDKLDRLVDDIQRATVMGSVRVIKNHLTC